MIIYGFLQQLSAYTLVLGQLMCFINNDVYLAPMSKDEVKGRGKKIKGQIREEVGKITDNKTEQIKGKIEQVEGKVQEEVGKIKRKAKK
jgi:uncharacterized protein YjbJ (UPF0337 family)